MDTRCLSCSLFFVFLSWGFQDSASIPCVLHSGPGSASSLWVMSQVRLPCLPLKVWGQRAQKRPVLWALCSSVQLLFQLFWMRKWKEIKHPWNLFSPTWPWFGQNPSLSTLSEFEQLTGILKCLDIFISLSHFIQFNHLPVQQLFWTPHSSESSEITAVVETCRAVSGAQTLADL